MCYYVTETTKDSGFRCRKAEKLKADTLQKARKEAVEKQFFEGTVLYVGEKVDYAGYLTEAVCEYRNGKWQRTTA